ncbi:MAG: cellulase family glycosylhydrolase [Chthoniobacterales bacterium]
MNPHITFLSRPRRCLRQIFVCGASFLSLMAARPVLAGSGLTVQSGVLMKDGSPYRGIGANYDTLFGRILRNKDDTSSLENLARLAQNGIPFVRFRANGFSPADQALYLQDPEEFFRRMDKVVRCAEQNHIGLIPSFFWRLATVEELENEPPKQVGNPNSRTSAYIRAFTRALVTRYKDSPAIWGWEFGNEANLAVDNPTGGASRGGRRFGLLPSTQVALTSSQLRSAYQMFAQTVRHYDSYRIIEPGTTIPRKAAWHNARGQFWQPDNNAQYCEALLNLTPDPMNVISAHVYPRARELLPNGASQIEQVISLLMQVSADSGKPLFIGEFPVRDRGQTAQFLRAIVSNGVPLSAFWVFDNKAQESTMSVDFDNERSFVFDLVAQANKALGGH